MKDSYPSGLRRIHLSHEHFLVCHRLCNLFRPINPHHPHNTAARQQFFTCGHHAPHQSVIEGVLDSFPQRNTYPFKQISRIMSSIDYENVPIATPAPGVIPNFVNPETRAPAVVAIAVVCLSLMWPISLLRLYTKIWINRSFGWDDGEFLEKTKWYYPAQTNTVSSILATVRSNAWLRALRG